VRILDSFRVAFSWEAGRRETPQLWEARADCSPSEFSTESAPHLRGVLSGLGGRIAWWSGCRRDRPCAGQPSGATFFKKSSNAGRSERVRGIFHVTIETPSRKAFEIEGAILKQALSDCLRDQRAALAQLADAAKEVDRAAFGSPADFGPAHQALLKALDRAEVLLQG